MKRPNGLTVIEVLIALVVSGIVISALFVGINFAGKYVRHNANKTMALNFAQGLMEEMKGEGYSDLDNYNGYIDMVYLYQGGAVSIPAERSVEVSNVTINGFVYKQVNVNVSWDWQGMSYTEEVNTLRSDY